MERMEKTRTLVCPSGFWVASNRKLTQSGLRSQGAPRVHTKGEKSSI